MDVATVDQGQVIWIDESIAIDEQHQGVILSPTVLFSTVATRF
jgi:hypothetical protein